MNSTSYYLFTRAQLLTALEAHVQGTAEDEAHRVRVTVLAFLDGDAAKAGDLIVTPLSGDRS